MAVWNNLHRGLAAVAIGAAVVLAAPASAAVTFSETEFPTSSYTLSPTYSLNGDVLVGQCGSCGNPGRALRFTTEFGAAGQIALAVLLNNFSYDTANGAISTVSASASKNLITSVSGPIDNFFRLAVQQNGTYYIANVLINQVTGPITTGFLTGSGTLTASNFLSYDFNTGTSGTANPDFTSGTLRFGLAQISTRFAADTTPSSIIYDNLSVTVATVPEPAEWALLVFGIGAVGAGLRNRRRFAAVPAIA